MEVVCGTCHSVSVLQENTPEIPVSHFPLQRRECSSREAQGLGPLPTFTLHLMDSHSNSAKRAPGSASKEPEHSFEKLEGVLEVIGQ